MASVYEVFDQSVYQFAGARAAASFYGQLDAKYRSCRSVSESDGAGGTARLTPRPTQASLTLRLIARVGALR